MSNKQDDLPVINKIEVNENAEPIIVEVTKKELLAEEKAEKKKKLYSEYDFVQKKTDKSIGKQLVMSRAFGIDKTENVNKRQRTFKIIFTITFIVFVVGVLLFTAYQDFFNASEEREPFTWEKLISILSYSWRFLIYALISLALCYLFKGLKLSVMCKSLTGKGHYLTCFETGIIGHYYNNVTPLAVGGQPFEIYHLSKHGVHSGVATSLPIAAFFMGQFTLVIAGIVSLCLAPQNDLFYIFPPTFKVLAIIGLICCLLMPLLVVVFSLMPRVGAGLVHFALWVGAKLRLVKDLEKTTYKTLKTVVHNSQCLKKIATRPITFLLSFLLSFAELASQLSIAYFTLKFFGYDLASADGFVEWLQIVQMCLLLNASISFIPTPGNSGAADLSFFILFESGLAVGLAFPAMTLWRLLNFYSFIIIGFVFATLKKKADHKRTLQNDPLA